VLKKLLVGLWVALAAVPLIIITVNALLPPAVLPSPIFSQAQREVLAKRRVEQGLRLWEQKQYQQSLHDFSLAIELGSVESSVYQRYGQRWLNDQQVNNEQTQQTEIWAPQSCLQQILFVTAELSSLVQATKFIQLFQSDTRLAVLPICISPQIVFTPNNLPCKSVNKYTRISCDIKPLASQLENQQFTHLVVFTKQGKANVHNGIMYLDQQDTYDVLVHEMAHFAGFVDEYPLSAELAKRVCSEAEAPNLVFKRADQKQIDMHFWQQLKQNTSVALTPARTCDNHTSQAFKPSANMTFMEYYDVKRIPDFYLSAWQQALSLQHNLTPAFINFAQAFEEQPANSRAHYWRERYEQYHQVN
jgi:hypothetical protein